MLRRPTPFESPTFLSSALGDAEHAARERLVANDHVVLEMHKDSGYRGPESYIPVALGRPVFTARLDGSM